MAHVYVNDTRRLHEVRDALERLPGVEQVLGADEKRAYRIDHPRAGDLVAACRR